MNLDIPPTGSNRVESGRTGRAASLVQADLASFDDSAEDSAAGTVAD